MIKSITNTAETRRMSAMGWNITLHANITRDRSKIFCYVWSFAKFQDEILQEDISKEGEYWLPKEAYRRMASQEKTPASKRELQGRENCTRWENCKEERTAQECAQGSLLTQTRKL